MLACMGQSLCYRNEMHDDDVQHSASVKGKKCEYDVTVLERTAFMV